MTPEEELRREIQQLRDDIAAGRLTIKHAEQHRRGGADPHGIIVEEADGAPSIKRVTKLIVTAGDLTDNGDGSALLATGGGGGGAPTTADFLVGTANAGLTAEIVVGTTPGGELGGTWASPTVDASHGGGTHAATQAAAEATAATALSGHEGAADPHAVYVREADANWIDLTDLGATTLHSHAGGGSVAADAIWDAAGDLAVGTGADTAARLAITVPAANILEVLGVVNGETTATWKAVHDGTAPADLAAAAAAGTALTAAHRDHVHLDPVVAHVADTTSVHEATSLGVTGVKQTLILQGWQPTGTAGCAPGTRFELGSTTKHDIWSNAFDSASAESAYRQNGMPANWDGGTVTFRVRWYAKTGYVATSSDGVAWTLKATSYGDGQTVDSVFGTGVTVTDTATANGEIRVTAASSALTIAGAAAGEFVDWVITRTVSDGVDNWAADVELIEVEITYGIAGSLSA